MKLFGLFGLLILLYCGCADRHRHKPFCEQELVDSLEVRVQDSLFSNVLYSRSQVRDSAGSGSSSDVESFKKLCEDNGTAYLAYAVNSEETAVLTLTSLRITPDETTGEILTAGDYARQNHDTAVFSYQASGMYIRNSSFGEEQLAGRSGYLSHFELCSDEEVSELILGQSEFTFEQDGKFYSIQTYYHNETAAADVDEILANMTAQ